MPFCVYVDHMLVMHAYFCSAIGTEAIVAGGIIITLLLLLLLPSLCLLLYRFKCFTKSSNTKGSMLQIRDAVNLDISANLNVNPSYHHVVVDSNDDDGETSKHEYDDITNESDTAQTNSSYYVEVVERTSKLHCENFGYFGSTK